MNRNFDVVVIGAGVLVLCVQLKQEKEIKRSYNRTFLKIAEKIRISGGGRCNFTNIYSNSENFYQIISIFVNLLFQNIRKMIS